MEMITRKDLKKRMLKHKKDLKQFFNFKDVKINVVVSENYGNLILCNQPFFSHLALKNLIEFSENNKMLIWMASGEIIMHTRNLKIID